MKKTVAFLLISFTLLSAAAGCRSAKTESKLPDDDSSISQPDLADEEQEAKESPSLELKAYKREYGPRFDLPDDLLIKYQNFVMPFNVMPEEFEDPGELSDFALIFTAAAAILVEFAPSEDGMSSSVPLSKIESRIREYFGGAAKLSEQYADRDYSPYEIDRQNGLLVQYHAGTIGGFFFPYALIELEDGYELWLIDLMDPLFFDDPENQERLFSGDPVSYDEIADIAGDMQYNIYFIKEQNNGRLMLAGYRCENFKNINHFLY